MTPTEQDDELQKAVWASLASQMTHAINCTDPEHKRQNSCVDFTEENFEQLMQLITADRKRVALEARINERNKIALDTYRGKTVSESTNWQAKFEYFMDSNERRIAQLKAQQEEV